VSRIRYQQIADEIRHEIASGILAPGGVLPSEAGLGAVHGVSRVTIRKALEILRDEGLVESRQGFGWLVSAPPVMMALPDLTTIESELVSSGRASKRQILDFRFLDAPPAVAEQLGERVLEVRRLNLADGEPFARVTVWCREELASSLSLASLEQSTFLELLGTRAVAATQSIGADLLEAEDAELLGVPPATAALVVGRTTRDETGRSILVSEHVFPAHLAEFVVELLHVDVDEESSPAGLRLVQES